jgi:signal recognition particle subunit SRP72
MPSSQRKTPSVKQALPVSDRVQRHFKSLVAQIDGGHISNAIKTCDTSMLIIAFADSPTGSNIYPVLRLQPTDADALQTKLSLLLHNEQYLAALALSETLLEGEEHASFQVLFGKAYALYRLTREQEAADVVKIIKPEGGHEERGVLHMEAQIVSVSEHHTTYAYTIVPCYQEYRRGNYEKAQALYSQIYDSSPPVCISIVHLVIADSQAGF